MPSFTKSDWVAFISVLICIITTISGQEWIKEYPQASAILATALVALNMVLQAIQGKNLAKAKASLKEANQRLESAKLKIQSEGLVGDPLPTPVPDPTPPIPVSPQIHAIITVIAMVVIAVINGLKPTPTPTPEPVPVPIPVPAPSPVPVPTPTPIPTPVPNTELSGPMGPIEVGDFARYDVPTGVSEIKWRVIARNAKEYDPQIDLSGIRSETAHVRSSRPGDYFVIVCGIQNNHLVQWEKELTISGIAPPPTPPKPPIPPKPEPEPPVVAGKRKVIIVRESSKDDAAMSRLLINLRDGTAADYLKSKGHLLDVLDADQLKPSDPWQPLLTDVTLPAAFYVDTETNTIVYKENLAKTVTADNVIETLKRHGG